MDQGDNHVIDGVIVVKGNFNLSFLIAIIAEISGDETRCAEDVVYALLRYTRLYVLQKIPWSFRKLDYQVTGVLHSSFCC
ncbi:hypothetical protein WK27_11390 [Burkholderia vietnamiensis]|nr:hypothetical protein WK27_11390 [Burkholderia vietnamiensis]